MLVDQHAFARRDDPAPLTTDAGLAVKNGGLCNRNDTLVGAVVL